MTGYPGPRPDILEVAKTLNIDPSQNLRIAYLESALSAEWWRGHHAGLLKGMDALKSLAPEPKT